MKWIRVFPNDLSEKMFYQSETDPYDQFFLKGLIVSLELIIVSVQSNKPGWAYIRNTPLTDYATAHRLNLSPSEWGVMKDMLLTRLPELFKIDENLAWGFGTEWWDKRNGRIGRYRDYQREYKRKMRAPIKEIKNV